MKVWCVVAEDVEALVVDETPEAAAAQVGLPDAEVREQKPIDEFNGIRAYYIPEQGGASILVKPDCEPLVLYQWIREVRGE